MGLLSTTKPAGPVDFSTLRSALAAKTKPFEDRARQVGDRYHDWSARQMADPTADVATDPPESVTVALLGEQQKAGAARRAFAAEVEPAILADLGARVKAIDSLYAALVDAIEDLRQFERERSAFNAACGVPAPSALGIGLDVSHIGLQSWRERVEAVLTPRVARPVARVAPVAFSID